MPCRLFALLLAALVTAPSLAALSPMQAAEAAKSLDSDSQATLGIGIRSISLLFHAGPGRFIRIDSLRDDGSWQLVQELETAGYARLTKTVAVAGEFVNVQLTPLGQAVIDTLTPP